MARGRIRGKWSRLCSVLILGAAMVVAFERLWPGLAVQKGHGVLSTLAYVAFLLRTFEFHLGLGVLALAAIALLLRARRPALLALLVAAAALLPTARSYFPTRGAAGEGEHGAAVRVMGVNLLLHLRDFGPVLAEIGEANPDVLCFTEYTPAAHGPLMRALGERYPFAVNGARHGAFGQAVYSRLPFVDGDGRTVAEVGEGWRQEVDMGEEFLGPQIRVVVREERWVGGHSRESGLSRGLLAVRCVHLTSPGGPRRAADQRREVRMLLGLVERDRARWPALVLAGDFNATAHSAQIGALRGAGLEESCLAVGGGRGTTWPRLTFLRWFPNIRIDHVLAGDPLRFVRAGKTGSFGSDHRGVWADVVRVDGGNGEFRGR